MLFSEKTYNHILRLSIFALSSALVWFAFVYYPKVLNEYKSGKVPAKSLLKPVSATSNNLPIETSAYRIIYEENSQTYYTFVGGDMLDIFEFNSQNAKLALKTALSVENLCNVNVIYVSAEQLKIPQNLANNSDC